MKLDIKITNFGKIQKAELKIRPFTVIAGCNSSGKSFITKALYSIFSTINTDYITQDAYKTINRLETFAAFIQHTTSRLSQKEYSLIDGLLSSILSVKMVVDETLDSNTYSDQVVSSFLLEESITELESSFVSLQTEMSSKSKYKKVESHFENIKVLTKSLKTISETPKVALSTGIESGLINSFKENFQVSSLDELRNNNRSKDEKTIFDLDALGSLTIQSDDLEFNLNAHSIDEFQKLYNVVYLESPIYWKLKGALDSLRKNERMFLRRPRKGVSYLSGVPKHFYDLLDLLDTKVKKLTPEIFDSSNIKEGIGGELTLSASGDISFKENSSLKNVNLHSTALGVTSLGIISLLIDKNIISEGSFIFIDEPEAHLHPSWQKIMIETLFELSKKGINVVIATHSIDMMKFLENIMTSEDDLFNESHFGINQLSNDGKSINMDMNPIQKIASIKDDLGETFLDMFFESELLGN